MRIWCVLGSVAAGISMQPSVGPGVVLYALAVGCPALAFRRWPRLRFIGLVLVSLGVGWGAAWLEASDGRALRAAAVAFPRCDVQGTVVEHAGGLGSLARFDRADCVVPQDGVVALSRIDSPPGTRFRATGWLRPFRSDPFDQARFRLGADAGFEVRSLTLGSVDDLAHRAAEGFRGSLARSARSLSDETRGLILGMAVGDTSLLSRSTLVEMRRAGLSHLLAVSGSNVAIVLGVVALSLWRSPLALRLAASAFALAFYVLVVGPQPSVLRAATMGAIALVAVAGGHPVRALASLGVALTILLLVRPGLLYAPGLHLSAAATAGIVLWATMIAERCRRWPKPVALAFGATVAAQFAVAPVLLFAFGELSVIAPLANLAAFPAVAPVTIVALAAAAIGLAAPGVGAALMTAIGPLADWVLFVGDRAGTASWASMELPHWTGVPAAAAVVVVARRTRRPAPVELPTRDDAAMGDWRWRLHDPEGNDMRTTDAFGSQGEAEAWMGAEWQGLLDEGAETVSLVQGDVTIYVMGLKEE